jgi:hypothetical protein
MGWREWTGVVERRWKTPADELKPWQEARPDSFFTLVAQRRVLEQVTTTSVTRIDFGIFLRDTDELIGQVQLSGIAPAPFQSGLSRVLGLGAPQWTRLRHRGGQAGARCRVWGARAPSRPSSGDADQSGLDSRPRKGRFPRGGPCASLPADQRSLGRPQALRHDRGRVAMVAHRLVFDLRTSTFVP